MRKAILTTIIVLALSAGFSTPGFADLNINFGFGFPPPVVFSAPPEVVVIPGTNVYVAPGMAEDLFFFGGYWWRPWNGHWYRSWRYNGPWDYYAYPPSAVLRIPSNWRVDYRNHRWGDHDWDYRPIPYHELRTNWKHWERSNQWEKPEYRQVVPGYRNGEVNRHFYRGNATFENRNPEFFERHRAIEQRRPETFEKQQMRSEGHELKGRHSEGYRHSEGHKKERVQEKEGENKM